MYKNEHEFSKAVTSALKRTGAMVTKIESHDTSCGIPDLFIAYNGHMQWIELKTDNQQSVKNAQYKFAWRPGQQAWYHNYKMHSLGDYVITLMSCKDGVVLARNNRIYPNNCVPYVECEQFDSVTDFVNCLKENGKI